MFRILSLDGGGIKGVFTAAALARIEQQSGARLIDHFDLLCGTSTGGILAIGLAMGLTASDLLDFYHTRGPAIFPATSLVQRSVGLLRQLFLGPKLSQDVLKRELSGVLGTLKFGDAKSRLVIPAYDAVRGRIYVFKTPHHARFINDTNVPAVDVALATAAAPTYFAAAAASQNGRFVDGGVWANCPVMVGLVEAVAFLNIPLQEVSILSIGTTSEPFSIAKNGQASALKWNIGLVNLMFEAQSEAALAQTDLLLEGRLHRVNFMANQNRFSLDRADHQTIADLTNLGTTEVERREHTDVIWTKFLGTRIANRYSPVRAPQNSDLSGGRTPLSQS